VLLKICGIPAAVEKPLSYISKRLIVIEKSEITLQLKAAASPFVIIMLQSLRIVSPTFRGQPKIGKALETT